MFWFQTVITLISIAAFAFANDNDRSVRCTRPKRVLFFIYFREIRRKIWESAGLVLGFY